MYDCIIMLYYYYYCMTLYSDYIAPKINGTLHENNASLRHDLCIHAYTFNISISL